MQVELEVNLPRKVAQKLATSSDKRRRKLALRGVSSLAALELTVDNDWRPEDSTRQALALASAAGLDLSVNFAIGRVVCKLGATGGDLSAQFEEEHLEDGLRHVLVAAAAAKHLTECAHRKAHRRAAEAGSTPESVEYHSATLRYNLFGCED